MSFCYGLGRESANDRHVERISEQTAELLAELFPREEFRDDMFDLAHHTVRAEITKCAAAGDKDGEMNRMRKLCESWIESRLRFYCDRQDLSVSEAADRIRYLYDMEEA